MISQHTTITYARDITRDPDQESDRSRVAGIRPTPTNLSLLEVPNQDINGHLKELCGGEMGFRSLTNYTASSLIRNGRLNDHLRATN